MEAGAEAAEEKKKEGRVVVEKVRGKSTVTRCFYCYPLKLILPNKVAPSKFDAVWIYALTYGGGIVSGDLISLVINVGDNCTAALTTQASTKTARYSQKQVFRVHSDSNLVVVDWITSGRHESGEKWEFDLYMSTNHIYLEADQPLFLDSVLLDQNSCTSIAKRMQEYQVMAMIILLGPKLKDLQCQLQEEVKQMMSVHFRAPNAIRTHNVKSESPQRPTRAPMIASCSPFGPQGIGMVVRIVAVSTESVYKFLRHHLAALDAFIGASPYSQSGR